MNPFLAFALWFVTVTLALVLWMLFRPVRISQ